MRTHVHAGTNTLPTMTMPLTPLMPPTSGIFFPIAWVVCCFLPICAKNAVKGPKDMLAVRRASVAASIALCLYLVGGCLVGGCVLGGWVYT